MNQPTILDMKREAAQALLAYRRMKNTLLLHDAPELLPEQAETMTLPEEASRAGRRRGQGVPLTVKDLETMRCWVAAVDAARAMLQQLYPLKARFMTRCFGLEVAIPRYQSAHQRLTKLALELQHRGIDALQMARGYHRADAVRRDRKRGLAAVRPAKAGRRGVRSVMTASRTARPRGRPPDARLRRRARRRCAGNTAWAPAGAPQAAPKRRRSA